MLKFYYTGAKEPFILQENPRNSLGCYISKTQVPNDVIQNVFSNISPVNIEKNKASHVLLAISNETGNTAKNIKIHFKYPSDQKTKILLGAIQPSQDKDGNLIFDEIGTINEKPIGINFYEADGVSNKKNIGNLGIDQYVGIWLRRELLSSLTKQYDTQEIIDGKNEESEEDIEMVIEWD